MSLDDIQRRIMNAPGVAVRRHEQKITAGGGEDRPARRDRRHTGPMAPRAKKQPDGLPTLKKLSPPAPYSARAKILAFLNGRPPDQDFGLGDLVAACHRIAQSVAPTVSKMVADGEILRSGVHGAYRYKGRPK